MAGGDSNSCNSGNCDGKGQVNIFYGSFSINCSWRGTSRDVQWSRLKTLFKTVGFGCFTTINVSAEEGKKKKAHTVPGWKRDNRDIIHFFSEFHYWTNCTRSISSGEIFHLGLLPLDNFGITYYVFMGWNHKCFMAVTNPWFSWISQPYSCAPSHSRVWLFFSSSSSPFFYFLQESGLRSHSTGTVVAPGDYLTTQSNEFSLTLSLCGEAVLYIILILQSNYWKSWMCTLQLRCSFCCLYQSIRCLGVICWAA